MLWPKAKARPVRWQDLRRSTAALLVLAGYPLAGAQWILRHTDPKITADVYAHMETEQLRAAVTGCRSTSATSLR